MMPLFMYMKKSTKIILSIITVILFIFLGYKIYEKGKETGTARALEEEKYIAAYNAGFSMYSYLNTLIYYIEDWNLGENKKAEKYILQALNNIKSTMHIKYNSISQLNYEYHLFNNSHRLGYYDNDIYYAGDSLYVFYNNLQLFFGDKEYIESTVGDIIGDQLSYETTSTYIDGVLTETMSGYRTITDKNSLKTYYMEDGILSEEEKQYINDCLELLKMSYERLLNNGYTDYDTVQDAIWLEYDEHGSMIVDFLYEDRNKH